MSNAAASAREHPPGTCRERGAEGLCRKCAAAFLGGGTSWFDDGPSKELPSVKSGGKRTWLIDDLRAWQRAHREEPSSPAQQDRRDLGPEKTAPGSGRAPPSPDGHGQRRQASLAAAIEKRLTEKLQRSISRNAGAAASGAAVLPFPDKSRNP